MIVRELFVSHRVSKQNSLIARWLELAPMEDDVAIGSYEALGHVETGLVSLSNADDYHDVCVACSRANAIHML